jgi:hypothetical protein
MVRLIKKYKKQLLAVFGVLLMVAFVADYGVRRVGRSRESDAGSGSFVGDEAIRVSEMRRAHNDWYVLTQRERIEQQVRGYMGQPQQASFSLAEFLLADRLTPALGREGGLQAARIILKEMDATSYLLLLREAQKMDVRLGKDMAQAYVTMFADIPSQDPEAREQAMLNWLTVLEAFDRVANGVKISPAAAIHAVAENEQKISTKLVEFKAEEFKSQVGEPTPQQLQNFFAKYRDENRQTHPEGFGYRYPNRVKIEYVIIPRDKLKEKVIDEDTYKFWKDNQAQFPVTQPASTQPTTAPALAATQPTTRPWREVKDQIKDQVAQQLAQQMTRAVQQAFAVDWLAYRQAIRGAATTQPVAPPSSLGPAFNKYLYLQRLQAKVQELKPSRQVLPELRSHDEFMTKKDLEELPGIGKAFTSAGGRLEDFPVFVIQRAEAFLTDAQRKQARDNNIDTLALFQPSMPFYSSDGNYYIVRITAADPAHAPATLVEVEKQVRDDWKTAQAHEKAKEAARKFAADARTKGLDETAKAAGDKPVLATGLFYNTPSLAIENYNLPEPARAAFVKGAFELLQQRIKSGQEHPLDVIDLPIAATSVVARLEAFDPAVKDDFFAQRVALERRQLEAMHSAQMLRDWFAPAAIESRMAFRSEQPRERPSAPAEAPPPLF